MMKSLSQDLEELFYKGQVRAYKKMPSNLQKMLKEMDDALFASEAEGHKLMYKQGFCDGVKALCVILMKK